MGNEQERVHGDHLHRRHRQEEEEAKIPVFTVLKNGVVLKNIFVISNKHTPSPCGPQVAPAGGEEVLTVGRHPDCDVVLMHPSVSRFHLQINTEPSSRKLFVTDLSSVHGTWVSERRIEPLLRVEVREGDSIRVGGSTRVYTLHWVPLSRTYGDDNLESDVAMAEENDEDTDRGNDEEEGPQSNSLLDPRVQGYEENGSVAAMSYGEEEEESRVGFRGAEVDRGNAKEGLQSNSLLDPGIQFYEENSTVAVMSHEEGDGVVEGRGGGDTEDADENQNQNLLAPEIEHFVQRSILATMGQEQEKEANQAKNSDTTGCREVKCFDSVLESITSLFSDEKSAFGLKNEVPTETLIPRSPVTASYVHEEDMEIPSEISLYRRHVSTLGDDRVVELEASCPALSSHGDQSVSQEVPKGEVVPCLMAGLQCKSEASVTADSFPSIDEVGFHLATDSTEETECKMFVTKDNGWMTKSALEKNPMNLISYDGDTSSDNVNKVNGITECSIPVGPVCKAEKEEYLTEDGRSDLLSGASSADYPAVSYAPEQVAHQFSSEESTEQLAEGSLGISYDGDTSSDDSSKGNGITECLLPIVPVCIAEKEEYLAEDERSNLLSRASSADYPAVSNAPEQVANQFPSEERTKQHAERSLGLSYDGDTGSDNVNKANRITECSIPVGPVCKAEKEEYLAEDGRSDLLSSASSAAVSYAHEQVANQFLSEESTEQLAEGSLGISYDGDTSSDDSSKGNGITECLLPVVPVCKAEKEEYLAEDERSNLLSRASSADYPAISNAPEQVANQFPSEERTKQLAERSLGLSYDGDTGSDNVNKANGITECSIPVGPVCKAEKEEYLAEDGRSDLLSSASSAAVSYAPEQVANQFLSEESTEQLAEGSLGISYVGNTSNDDVNEGNGITECLLPVVPVCKAEKEEYLAEDGKSDLLSSASSAAVSYAPEQVANQFLSEESTEQLAEGSLGISYDGNTSNDDVNKGNGITECLLPVVPVCKAEKEEYLAEDGRSNLLSRASSADYPAISNAPEQVANQFHSEERTKQLAERSLGLSYDGDTGSDNVNKANGITECSIPVGPVCKAEKEDYLAEDGRSDLLSGASSADYFTVSDASEQEANQLPSEERTEQLAEGSLGISYDGDTSSDNVKGNEITECSVPIGPVYKEEKKGCLPEDGRFNLLSSASFADYAAFSNALEQLSNQFPSEESTEQLAEGSLEIELLATEVLNSSFSVRQLVSEITDVKENQTMDSNFCSNLGRLNHTESPHVRLQEKLGDFSTSSKRIELFASAQACTLSAGRMVKEAEHDREANSDSQWEADKGSSIPFTETEVMKKEDYLSDKEHNLTPKTPLVQSISKQRNAEAVRDVPPCKSASSKIGFSPNQDVIASCDKENQTPGAVSRRKSKAMTLMNQAGEKVSQENRSGRVPLQQLNVNGGASKGVPDTSFSIDTTSSSSFVEFSQSVVFTDKISQENNRSGRVPLQQLNVNRVGNGVPDASLSEDITSSIRSVDCSQFVVANLVGKSLSEASFPIPRKLNLDGVGRRWCMVVDSTTLLDKESRKSLQLLQGLKSTRLIIPRTVLEELACLEKQSSIFFGRRTDASLALEWIKKCTAESQWWIHLQKTLPNGSSTVRTSPPSLKSSLTTSLLQSLVGWKTSKIVSPTADDDLIDCALCYKRICSDEQFVLLSNNANLRKKAMTKGMVCETAPQFRYSLVNPFSERFLWGPSSPRGRTWSVVDDVVLKEHFYCGSSEKSEKRELTNGLKIILLSSYQPGKSFC